MSYGKMGSQLHEPDAEEWSFEKESYTEWEERLDRARIEAILCQQERHQAMRRRWLKVVKVALEVIALTILGYALTVLWMAL